MKRFAFICHPLSFQQLAAIDPEVLHKSPRLVRQIMAQMPPARIRTVEITSPHGETVLCELICIWLLPDQFLTLDPRLVKNHLHEALILASNLKCELIGLGAYTKIAAVQSEETCAKSAVPITTGNTFTAALAVSSMERLIENKGKSRSETSLVVVGARGAIGKAVAHALAPLVGELRLVGRNVETLLPLAESLNAYGCRVSSHSEINAAARDADFIFLATSDPQMLIQASDLARDTCVVDVSKPVNILADPQRPDVKVIDCAMVQTPLRRILQNHVRSFPHVEGLDSREVFACFAESMILALEGRAEVYSTGRLLEARKFPEILNLARKHGFSTKLALGPWSFNVRPEAEEKWKATSSGT